jgi:DNA modification methylase
MDIDLSYITKDLRYLAVPIDGLREDPRNPRVEHDVDRIAASLRQYGLREAGFHWSATVIWAKDQFVMGRGKYHRRYEPIWYGWNKAGKSTFCGGRDQDDVWEYPRPRKSPEHPTMKPLPLVERAISNSSQVGDVVFDPFGGSGTTLIAGHRLKRLVRIIEKDPRYVAVILERWSKMTGQQPILHGAA